MHAESQRYPRWVWTVAVVWSTVVIGAGLALSIATGNWWLMLAAVTFTLPLEIMAVQRQRRMPPGATAGA